MKNKFGLNVIVAINKFGTDTQVEINLLKTELEKEDVLLSLVESHEKGGEGAIDIAEKLVKLSEKEDDFKFAYNNTDSIKQKNRKNCLQHLWGKRCRIFRRSNKTN